MDPSDDPRRKKADDEARRKKAEDDARRKKALLAERQKRRAEEAEEDARVAEELRAEEARIAALERSEETRDERRAREDAEVQQRRDEEDRVAKREAEKKKEVDRKSKAEGKKPQLGGDSDSAVTRGRAQSASFAARRSLRPQRSPVGAFTTMFPPRPSERGSHREISPESSLEDADAAPEPSISITVRSRSHKRSAEGSHRDESRSISRGGAKRARKAEPLIPGVKCVRCARRNQSCVPATTGRTCQACRDARTRCENPSDAGTDRAWVDRALELGEQPGLFHRVYGPVSTPVRGFEEVDDHLWGKWLDIQSRISLQVVNAIDRTNALIEVQTEFLRQHASAATLSALTAFHAELARQHAEGDRGAKEFYRRLNRDYRSMTGVDLTHELGRVEDEDAVEDALDASGSGAAEDVAMGEDGVADGEGEEEDPGRKPDDE